MYTEAARQNLSGFTLTPTAKEILAKFIVDHVDHNIKIMSEYDEQLKDQKLKELTRE